VREFLLATVPRLPTVQFTAATASGAESATSVNLGLTLSSAASQDVTVAYAVTGGTATGGGTDYTLASGTATISVGSTTTNIALTVVNDSTVESDETVVVTISSPSSNATLGSNTAHTYTISNDDYNDLTGIAAVSAGGFHSCALTTGGALKCWGQNTRSELGDGSSSNRTTAVSAAGVLATNVASVSAGSLYTCIVTTSGGAKCWGEGSAGQLGDGGTTDRTSPVDVSGLTSGVSSIETGTLHTCVVTTSGGVKCWGDNTYGQLGDASTTDRTSPVDVSGGFSAHTVATGSAGDANGMKSVYATDVDGDGDVDVLSFSYFNNTVAWYENDGSESFSSHTIATTLPISSAGSIYATDVDSDGDVDVLSASSYGFLAWHENNGSESFSAHTISTSVDGALTQSK